MEEPFTVAGVYDKLGAGPGRDGMKTMTAVREAKLRHPLKKANVSLRSSAVATLPKGKGAYKASALERTKSEFLMLSRGWAVPSMDNISQVREGLAVNTLDGLNSIVPGIIYRVVPKSTLATLRKRSERLPPEQSNRVYQTGKVIGFAMTLYRDEEKVREFLTRRHPMLEDRRPLDVALESSAGADLVINLLGRGAYGGGA